MTKTKSISYLVVIILGSFAILGLFMTWDLCRIKVAGELVAVMSGLTGTAIGAVGSMLSRTDHTPTVADTTVVAPAPVKEVVNP